MKDPFDPAPLNTTPCRVSRRRFRTVKLSLGVGLFLAVPHPEVIADEPAEGQGAENTPRKEAAQPVAGDERPPGGNGSMFFKVFVSRNDKNGDGVIEKSEFRGGGARFDQMDTNRNGKLDRAEIDKLHRSRMADPLSMRQRIARGETRRPPVDLPAEAGREPNGVNEVEMDDEPSALTPLGTRITAKQAFARLDVDKSGTVTASEFQRSPGMADPEKAAETVARIDGNGDGSLSFGEFNAVFAKRHPKQPGEKEKPEPAQSAPN